MLPASQVSIELINQDIAKRYVFTARRTLEAMVVVPRQISATSPLYAVQLQLKSGALNERESKDSTPDADLRGRKIAQQSLLSKQLIE